MINKKFVVGIVLIIQVISSFAQDINFQGVETNKNKQPTKHDRQPIESDKCLEGEYLYPGDNEKDWVCDCKPVHVYYPETMKCYQVYDQGPCKKGEILQLIPKRPSPKCFRNTCPQGKVNFKGKCVALNGSAGCPQHTFVKVNSTDLQLTCSFNLDSRFGEDEVGTPLNITQVPIDEIGAACLFAGKRSQENKCV